jgi:two-component sensor histidine kinase
MNIKVSKEYHKPFLNRPMTIGFVVILFCLFQSVNTKSFAQKTEVPYLESSLTKEGLLVLNYQNAWLYHPGDNLGWSALNIDDSDWHQIYPIGLKAEAMPDSIWPGYGWWRFKFTTDTQIRNQIQRLYFSTWGAADVFLDGELVNSYGNFSKNPALETSFIPNYSADKALRIAGEGVHVLAIRFSNHQAKRNQRLLRKFSSNLGFFVGLATEERGLNSDGRFANSMATLSVIAVVLIILLVLHLLLYLKFKGGRASLMISLITVLFLIAAISAHILLFLPLNSFWDSIVGNIINSLAFGAGFSLLPYTLVLLFGIKKYDRVKHLIWLLPIRTVNYYIHFVPFIIFDASIIFLIITLMLIVMFKGIQRKQVGVHYATFGAIGTAIFLLVNRLQGAGVISLYNSLIYFDLILLYISFPLGIYIYITNQFGNLYNSMEKEVGNRTIDLNLSIQNLESTQKALGKKNQENELLLKEIHHRVKNNLEIVSSLLELQSSQIEDPSIQEAMLLSQNRVHSMGIIHQKLYQGEHLASIEMRDYFENLGQNIADSFNSNGRIKIECDMPKMLLDVDTAVPVGLIVNELITNSFKYAFEGNEKGLIKISLRDYEEDKLELVVSDDGNGIKENEPSKGTGFGGTLIHLLAKQLDGSIAYQLNNGTLITLIFQKKKTKI